MRSRAFQPVAAILGVLLLASTPVHAGPVAMSDVIQIISSFQNPPDLRLRGFSQTGVTPIAGVNGAAQKGVNPNVDSSLSGNANDISDSIIAGVAASATDSQRGVEIIAQGDVDGTICDCGEIWLPGGFPRWPLLFLAGIPFFFIDGDETLPPNVPPPVPTPPPPTTVIPEPTSLLLFGTGLVAFGAGLRRRYAKAKLAAQSQNAEEALAS